MKAVPRVRPLANLCSVCLPLATVFLFSCADKSDRKKPPTKKPDVPNVKAPTHDREPDASVADTLELPPKNGATPLRGTLAGKNFEPSLVYLREDPRYANTLTIVQDDKAEACEVVPKMEGRVVLSISKLNTDFSVGVVLSEHQLWIQHPGELAPNSSEKVKITLDSVDRPRKQITGRIALVVGEKTNMSGSFEGILCPSEQKVRSTAPPINGMDYGLVDVPANRLSSNQTKAVIIGHDQPITDAFIIYRPAPQDRYELILTAGTPASSCPTVPGVEHFAVGLGSKAPVDKYVVHGAVTRRSPTNNRMIVRWNYDAKTTTYHETGYRSIVIDEAKNKMVSGRIYAWFDDPGKSFVVGRFNAKDCTSR